MLISKKNMDRDEIFGWVTAERLSLADFLGELNEDEWRVQSLCSLRGQASGPG